MAINRSALKRNSASALLDKVKSAATSKGNNSKDERFWEPTIDPNGNGFAVVRFLPAKTEEGLPFVKVHNHGFKVGTKWYIENCPTTIGGNCPVCEANNELWSSGFDEDKKVASARKRKLRHISNVMVIKDPKNPENEGKVFLFSYGQKLFEKLSAAMNPPEEYGEQPRDPFGFFDGCVMKIKIKNLNKQRNYDDTTVEAATDLFDGDEEKLLEVLDKMHDLQEFVGEKQFKPFDELKSKFASVLGAPAPKDKDEEENRTPASTAKEHGDRVRKPSKSKSEDTPAEDPPFDTGDSVGAGGVADDEDMAFFRGLADDE